MQTPKRAILSLPPKPPSSAPGDISRPTLEMSDADLLAAAAHHPDLVNALRTAAHAAYLSARAAPNVDWQTLDGRWTGLLHTLRSAQLARDVANPNSAPDKLGLLTAIKAALSATRDFDAVKAQCEGAVVERPIVPSAVYAQRFTPQFGRHPLDVAEDAKQAGAA